MSVFPCRAAPLLVLLALACTDRAASRGAGATNETSDATGGDAAAAAGGEATTPGTTGTSALGAQAGGNGIPGAAGATGATGATSAGSTPTGGAVTTANGSSAAVGFVGGPNNAYRLVGRFDASVPGAVRFSLPNSRVGISFTGDSLAVSLAGDGTDVFGVSIDGGAPVAISTAPSAAQVVYPVAQNLGAGPHTAWLTKRTEAREASQADSNVRTGTAILGGFVLAPNATLQAPPAPRPRLIVALGDSSTTGYGVGQLQQNGVTCVYTPATQNAERSVIGQLGDLLAAEVLNVSASGKGVVQSAYDLGNPDQLPALWQKAVPPAATPAYDFVPQNTVAVLISAGSDDLVGDYGVGVISDPAKFVATYAALLSDMRTHYPTALLVGIVNPNAVKSDKSTLQSLIDQAVAQRSAAGDANVISYDYFAGDANGWISYNDADAKLGLGHGCQGHASDAGSLFLAQRLATLLRGRLAL